MTTKDKQIRQYFRQIQKCIPGGAKGKKQILSNIQQSVENYLLENPDADFNTLQSHFGTPQQVAEAYIENMNADEIMGKLNTKKLVLRIAIGAVIVAILIWAICLIVALNQNEKDVNGYYEVEIIETTEESK